MTAATGLMRHDPVTDLATHARHGDQQAWGALVERYAPLIWSICRRYRLGRADADDVAQYVWLTLVGQLGNIRDPAALPGWLATTAARECARTRCAAQRPPAPGQIPQADSIPDTPAAAVEQELQQAERRAALREAFTCLPPRYRRLLAMLIQDPPVPYAQISAELGIPVGSIGPIRSRCLAKLRRHPAIAALINLEIDSVHHSPDRAPSTSSGGRRRRGSPGGPLAGRRPHLSVQGSS